MGSVGGGEVFSQQLLSREFRREFMEVQAGEGDGVGEAGRMYSILEEGVS